MDYVEAVIPKRAEIGVSAESVQRACVAKLKARKGPNCPGNIIEIAQNSTSIQKVITNQRKP
jgi:hypothetical protein